MQGGDGAPVQLFYSYSHEDEDYRKKLGKHLSVLRRAGLITDWHDREMDAGTPWQEEIDRHLLSADIVLLLVSASFIASDYCWGDEMTKALARHKDGKARVIPIILHPCGWLRMPLQALQGVPRDNKAISLWSNEHAAFDHVVTEIAKVVDDLRRRKSAEPELVERASAVAVVASAPSPESPAPPANPPAGEGDLADAAGIPRPPAGEGGTRDSRRVRDVAREMPTADSLSRSREREGPAIAGG
jgi:TIR domain